MAIRNQYLANIKSLFQINAEGAELLNTTRNFGCDECYTFPETWVVERLVEHYNDREYTLDEFANDWFSNFTHAADVTVDTLKQRLAPWYAEYERITDEVMNYHNDLYDQDGTAGNDFYEDIIALDCPEFAAELAVRRKEAELEATLEAKAKEIAELKAQLKALQDAK
jgi:hypothetical protein